MMADECGIALVLVYANGRRDAVLVHEHDGGPAYMAPLIRRAVAYARTHYDSGNIVDVLESEPEMVPSEIPPEEIVRTEDVRHFYYIGYRWDEHAGKKHYMARALHFRTPVRSVADVVPYDAREIPDTAKSVI